MKNTIFFINSPIKPTVSYLIQILGPLNCQQNQNFDTKICILSSDSASIFDEHLMDLSNLV